MQKSFKTPKQRSRERVVQALYQWRISGGDLLSIEHQFLTQKKGKISKAFFSNLIREIPKNITLLDNLNAPCFDRELKELFSVEHAILYLGAFELKFSIEVPYKVVINESVEIAKLFGAEGSYKLVNTALDKLSKDLRRVEINA